MNPKIVELAGHKVMVVGNAPISIYPPPISGYWCEMVPEKEPKKVLILGFGAGTTARLINDKFPRATIIGVDSNEEILALARKEMDLDGIKATVIVEDAFEYIKDCKQRFDLVIVDLWDGPVFNTLPLSPDFMDKCKKLLTSDGKILLNAPSLDVMAEAVGFNERTEIHTNSIYKYENSTK